MSRLSWNISKGTCVDVTHIAKLVKFRMLLRKCTESSFAFEVYRLWHVKWINFGTRSVSTLTSKVNQLSYSKELGHTQKSPAVTIKRALHFTVKRALHFHKSSLTSERAMSYVKEKSPSFSEKSPTFSEKSPTFSKEPYIFINHVSHLKELSLIWKNHVPRTWTSHVSHRNESLLQNVDVIFQGTFSIF